MPDAFPQTTVALEQLAIGRARQQDFGEDALRINLELLARSPNNLGALTRVGRCYEVARDFARAAQHYEAALQLQPTHTVAHSRLMIIRPYLLFPSVDVTRILHTRPTSTFQGFQASDFAELGTCPDARTVESRFADRFDSLGQMLNNCAFARELQRLRGAGTAPLFWRGSLWAHPGHIYTYHHGGRWTAQANIGVFSATHWGDNRVRIGIGFNVTPSGRDRDREEGQRQVLESFTRLKTALAGTLAAYAQQWVGTPRASVDVGHLGGAFSSVAGPAGLQRFTSCSNERAIEWLFMGKWLRLAAAEDQRIMCSARSFVTYADSVFRELIPLFRAAW